MSEFAISDQVKVRFSPVRTSYRVPRTSELEDMRPWSETELALGFRFPSHAQKHVGIRRLVTEALHALTVGITGFLLVCAAVVSAVSVIQLLFR